MQLLQKCDEGNVEVILLKIVHAFSIQSQVFYVLYETFQIPPKWTSNLLFNGYHFSAPSIH